MMNEENRWAVGMAVAGAALAAMIFATPVAAADETPAPSTSEATETEEPTGTETPDPTSTETPEPTETVEPTETETETEEPEVVVAGVPTVKVDAPASTTARPARDEPVVDPCELSLKYRPKSCAAPRVTVTVAPR